MSSPLWSIYHVAVLLTAISLLAPPPLRSFAADISSTSSSSVKELSLSELEQGIADRLKRVEEFKFIQEEAARLGVRAWLFGGTAAGYAHYVKWDMQREKGDPRFQKDRFDYDYTNIYRSTQDLDIVIDGDAEQAQKLQLALEKKYPHLQGSKTAWEVRLLTQDMGDKQAILNNPDFMNQHTDSNSTGMVELTKPKRGETVVRDVRDWNSKDPYFLKDVYEGKLHYYFSPLHETTQFAKEGRNPPIISVIRLLTKAFQYELEIRPEDLARVKKVIDEFFPARAMNNDYVAKWIEKNGKKLFQNAVNIEYAWDTLDKLGLRQKLAAIKGDTSLLDSLAWWMNKEPLRTKPMGAGLGRTADELGLNIVAHETNNFLAYESITRAHTGDPNVLVSRNGIAGEAAAFGDGFYTQVGHSGAVGTGLTIRFTLDPAAREGSDFGLANGKTYVVIKNKAALKVIPESLNIGPVEYFEMLANDEAFSAGDRGVLEKLKRRINSKNMVLSASDERKIIKIVREQLKQKDIWSKPVLKEWFSFPWSLKHPEWIADLIRKGGNDQKVAEFVLSQPHWKDHPEWVQKLIERGEGYGVAKDVLSYPHWKDHPEFVESLLKDKNNDEYMIQFVLSKPHWGDHPEWVEQLIKKNDRVLDDDIIVSLLSQSHWSNHPEWVEHYLKKRSPHSNWLLVKAVLSQPHWKSHPDFVKELIETGTLDGEIAKYVLTQPHWKDHPEWVRTLIKRGSIDEILAEHVLSTPTWKDHPKLVEQLLKKNTVNHLIAKHVLSQPYWANKPKWVSYLIDYGKVDDLLAKHVLSKSAWKDHPELVESLLEYESVDDVIADEILSKPHWNDHPEWVERIIDRGKEDFAIARSVLSQPHWQDHPELLERMIKKGKSAAWPLSNFRVLERPHWKNHPKLLELTGGKPPTFENLQKAFNQGKTLFDSSPAVCVKKKLKKSLE
jgi:hypothetical protein